ncbi:Uma2 family endonuclease [Planomonospora corallina]|uniref:Uma2 family endonuclease n=1 Tax=Planomonospora corallina TaxID=1806052 RepID=A0ABV8I716_9ACTN
MTALPADSWLLSIRPQPARVTAEEYEALPEEIARAIEIVDGYVVYCAVPTPDHQTAGRRLADLLERYARAAMGDGHECLTVDNDVDLRLRDVPLLNRRPDVTLYRCLDRPARPDRGVGHRALPAGPGGDALQAHRHLHEGRAR